MFSLFWTSAAAKQELCRSAHACLSATKLHEIPSVPVCCWFRAASLSNPPEPKECVFALLANTFEFVTGQNLERFSTVTYFSLQVTGANEIKTFKPWVSPSAMNRFTAWMWMCCFHPFQGPSWLHFYEGHVTAEMWQKFTKGALQPIWIIHRCLCVSPRGLMEKE